MITLFKVHIWSFCNWKYGQYIIISGMWMFWNWFQKVTKIISVDPDQTSHSETPCLGLHLLSKLHLQKKIIRRFHYLIQTVSIDHIFWHLIDACTVCQCLFPFINWPMYKNKFSKLDQSSQVMIQYLHYGKSYGEVIFCLVYSFIHLL